MDIWDAVHKFTKVAKHPFMVKINGKTLYKYEWDGIKKSKKQLIKISGVRKTFMYYSDQVIGKSDEDLEAAAAGADSGEAKAALTADAAKKAAEKSAEKKAPAKEAKPKKDIIKDKKDSEETGTSPAVAFIVFMILGGSIVLTCVGFIIHNTRTQKRKRQEMLDSLK